MKNCKELLKNITTFIFDVDGVCSDGTVLASSDGEQLRTFYVKDGYALQLAVKLGYRICIISGGKSEAIRKRFDYLGIKDVFLGADNKLLIFHQYVKENNLKKEEILYMGDDIPDYLIMKEAGVAACPSDAAAEIKDISVYISHYPGGRGCVRDVIEQVMRVQDKWLGQEAFHW
jgi:3-deoxy-D-manno-octulosonate 8-phosphate phosphatase (KDO 8-P phosphatase)